MKYAKLIALLVKLGIITADKEADATKALEALPGDEEPLQKKVDASAIADPAIRSMFETVTQKLAASDQMNKQLLEAMTSEKTARENAQKTIDAQMKSDAKKKVEDAIAKALTEGRIAAADKDTWVKVLENDFDSSSKILTTLPVNPALQKTQGQAAGTDKGAAGTSTDKKTEPAAIPGPIGRVNADVLGKVMSFGNVQN